MKTKSRKRCSVNVARWASYAAAGAVTAVAASNDSAVGAIFYSGPIDSNISPAASTLRFYFHTLTASRSGSAGPKVIGRLSHHVQTFPPFPGQPAQVSYFAQARPRNVNSNSAHIRGTLQGAAAYASKLLMGASISGGHFNATNNRINGMAAWAGHTNGVGTTNVGHRKWTTNSTGFLGFEFNTGAGEQYGWARITMSGGFKHEMEVVDYAYGTPGQVIVAGQEVTPEPASLGLLAIGALGLLAARRGRKGKIA